MTGNADIESYELSHPRLYALVKRARALPAVPTAVVYAHDAQALRAALDATRAGLILPVFYGSATRMRAIAQDINRVVPGDIEDTGDSPIAAAQAAVRDTASGRCLAIMKGSLHTDELLGAVVARDSGLRDRSRITHTFLFDLPCYGKLLALTDAVINISPGIEVKSDAIANSVALLERLGVDVPKVAVLAAVETVTASIPATLDAALLVFMAGQGRFGRAIVEGPMGFDNAFSRVAANTKGIVSVVAGEPDLLVAPDLNAGNLLYKSFVYVGGGECAGLVQGARVPIILTSRADSHFSRIASCALAVIQHAAS